MPRRTHNLSKSGFISEEDHSGYKSQDIAIRALKEVLKFGLNGPIKRILSIGEVPQRTRFAFSDHSFTRFAAK